MTVARPVLALAASLLVGLPLHAQQETIAPSRWTAAPMIEVPEGAIEIVPIRGNVSVLMGAGGNIVASVGADGVLLVDTGLAARSDQVLAAVQRLQREWQDRNRPAPVRWGAETRSSLADRHVPPPPKPIRYIVNTHVHADHTGGNERLRNAGRTFTGGNVAGNIADAAEGAAILAHENVALRLARGGDGQEAAPFDAMPTDTYFVEYYKLSHFFNGEGVQLIHAPKAHTDGDSLVHFRGTDVIALGDLMSTVSYPIIDIGRGGHINGIIDALNHVLDLAIAEFRLEGGTMMVPGHGRVVDSADVAYYRDMLTIIRDRIEALVRAGRTLDQVKAAKPTADYDPRYGATDGIWTTEQFIEAIYRNLGGGQPQTASRGRQ